MNAQIFTFCLFLLWLGVTLTAFVFGPLLYPKTFDASRMQFIGIGAGLLTLWNFVKWWSIRMRIKTRELENRYEVTPLRGPRLGEEQEEDKPVVNPEFRFDDDAPAPSRVPPPPPPNGKGHH